MRASTPRGLAGRIATSVLFAATLVACGGDEGGDDVPADAPPDVSETQGVGGNADVSNGAAVAPDSYDLPVDYPLPAPAGGTLLSALFDDASGSSNVTIAYPLDSLDGLIEGYDAFFDTVDGETVRVPLTDGLASWQNDAAGYSVIVNGQNADVQVKLQTGI